MGDALKKTQAGQKLEIPAEAYNAFIDAVRDVRGRRHDVAQDANEPLRQSGIVKVRNKSGGDRDRFDVLMIDDPIIGPTDNLQQYKNQVAFEGDTPSVQAEPGDKKEPVKCKKFAILLEPLAENGIGRATISGVSVVRVNVIRETDPFADIEIGNATSLRSVPFGTTRILWKEPGVGVKWAVVRLSDRPRLAIFQLSGIWAPGNPSADPPEPNGWAKMVGCRPVFYYEAAKSYAADGSEPSQTIWHAVGYPAAERAAVIALHKTTGLFPAKFGCGDWVWCHWNDHECRWQVMSSYEDHWRFKLLTPLSRCGSASAQLVLYAGGKWCPVPLIFTVNDALGVVCPDICGGSTSGGCCSAESVPAAPTDSPSILLTAASGKCWPWAKDAVKSRVHRRPAPRQVLQPVHPVPLRVRRAVLRRHRAPRRQAAPAVRPIRARQAHPAAHR